ncbi:MAG TPA: glycosyltransferase family 39 protein [Candidatus Saccharimonadales bacterium]|nr:glycosyltransferase family 39 protein [Candidatus Saccharimonadales bacterium]
MKKLIHSKTLEITLLLIILLGAFVVRLYRFNNPVADWHSWRQADTSSVSRNFVKYGFDVMHPRIDNISNVQSGLDNPQGYFFAEFPIYNILQAGGYVLFGHFTIEEWGRLVSIIASIFGMLFVYLLVKKYGDKVSALAATFFYAFMPFSIYWGRTILPDSLALAFLLGGIYFFDGWLSKIKLRNETTHIKLKRYIFFVLSLGCTACAFLVRPHVLFFSFVFIYLAWMKWGISIVSKWRLYFFAIFALLPLGLWRLWIIQYPEGIPANAWLFNAGNIRFTGAFFYWLFAERIGRLILGYWGVALLVLGLLWRGKKNVSTGKHGWGIFVVFFFSSLVYLTVIARGNVQHDYYQYITIPSIVMLLGCGVGFLIQAPKDVVNKWMSWGLAGIISIFTLAFGWYYIRDYFNINNHAIVKAGQIVDASTPKNAKVLALYDGDSSFLYQTNRFGWASFEKPLPEMINKLGAGYLVLVNPKPDDYNLGKQYMVVSSDADYILFNLREKP